MRLEFFNSKKNKLIIVGILSVLLIVLFIFYRIKEVKDKSVIKDFSTNPVKILSPDELKKIIPPKLIL